MNINDLSTKVTEYAVSKLLPSTKTWLTKFAIGGFLPDIPANVEKLARMTNSVSPDGNVDVQRMKSVVMSGFNAAGRLDLLGGMLGFEPKDAEQLFDYILER